MGLFKKNHGNAIGSKVPSLLLVFSTSLEGEQKFSITFLLR